MNRSNGTKHLHDNAYDPFADRRSHVDLLMNEVVGICSVKLEFEVVAGKSRMTFAQPSDVYYDADVHHI